MSNRTFLMPKGWRLFRCFLSLALAVSTLSAVSVVTPQTAYASAPAGPATKVAITVPSVGTQRGAAFTTQPQVTIQDANSETVTSSTAVVTASITSGVGGTLVGSSTATAVSGIATFVGFGINGTIGTTYTITYRATGLTVATATVRLTGTTCDGLTFTCQVGDTGPGGGTVFYVAPSTFTQIGATISMCTTLCKYLEAAPGTWFQDSGGDPTRTWAQTEYRTQAVPNYGDRTSALQIGYGYRKTQLVIAQGNTDTSTSAAALAQSHRGGGQIDWFLPTFYEMHQLCNWQNGSSSACRGTGSSRNTGPGASGFISGQYWMSAEATATNAYRENMLQGGGQGFNDSKGVSKAVRPTRAFGTISSSVATLSALTLSTGTLSPTFATGTYSYTASVLNETSTVTVTPTRTQANATIQARVNSGSFTTVASGSASGSLSLNVGSNTIDVKVTAQNGITTETYTITVTRSSALDAPAFTLSSSSETVTVGSTINGFSINSTGGTIASYSISPEISNTPGLSFSTSTGLITGTPTTAASSRTYTITATNATSPSATRTFAVTVNALPPNISIGTTSFTPGTASNVGVTLSGFDQTQSYQVTIKFVNTLTNSDVVNGTLLATQGTTSLVFGYNSYSASKLGFKGTYAAISAALTSLTWNPLLSSGGTSIRIGIASMPGEGEFYDANSGRYYKYVSTATPWEQARTNAEATYLFGLQGYLAEINSESENTFIAAETSAENVWIGAAEDVTTANNFTGASYDGSSGQRWIWNGANLNPLPVGSGAVAQGALASFSRWATYPDREPNNDSRPGADCAVTNWVSRGFWNDLPCVNSYSYLMEFGGRPNEISTAITSTLTTTLTAVGPSVLTVRYDRNGASGLPARESDRYLPSTGPITLPGVGTMSRPGQTLVGWSRTGRTPVENDPYTPAINITLKAVWTPIQYTITYNANGGNATPTQASRFIGQRFTLANAITRANDGLISYSFAGWKNGSIISNAGETITVGSANLAYTAEWAQLYEVTYAANGGTFTSPDTEKESECGSDFICAADDFITLNSDPTRVGYTFNGWLDQNGTLVSDLDSGSLGIQTIVTSDRYIFSASWTPVSYTITYVSSGSTAPTQSSLNIGQTFAVGAEVTRANYRFNGWSDGNNTYWPESDYVVGSNNITLTAEWIATFTVTYSAGLGTGLPPSNSVTYQTGDNFRVLDDPGLQRSGFTFGGWGDGTATYQPAASYVVGTSNITLTAQWTEIPVAPTPAPEVVPTPVVPVGPPPSVLKTITNPKISRDDKGYYCQVGKYVFLREGRTEETPKLTTQVFSLLSNGTVIDSIKSALDKVLFTKSDTYSESTLTCQVDVGQENLMTTSYSLNSADISTFASVRKSAIEAADVKYYKDREDAYTRKDQEFVRLAAVRSAAVLASKSSREVSAASANYQKAYKAASELWKKELADASTNRVLAKELAQKIYLESLESAGISIYPTPVKAIVTPTPTPTPTPKPTPTPTPTPVVTTIPQPTAQMVKVGTVYMATGSYSLNNATKITLKAIALKINASDAKSILVYGHTDSRGGVNNTVLSQNRAKAVANYLRPLLKGKKITVGWYASRKPVAGGNSAADLAKNRRVEVYSK
jgi:uncharacterized repeat protein (TIGR02543 family)